jgi:hypothetical protein|tara:strand:+ start:149 stop:376 length:228 start_codon:yes stop_codon:yes gene_type:complete
MYPELLNPLHQIQTYKFIRLAALNMLYKGQVDTTTMDLFSSFVNWLSASGKDLPVITREKGGQDFFSRFMNKISG